MLSLLLFLGTSQTEITSGVKHIVVMTCTIATQITLLNVWMKTWSTRNLKMPLDRRSMNFWLSSLSILYQVIYKVCWVKWMMWKRIQRLSGRYTFIPSRSSKVSSETFVIVEQLCDRNYDWLGNDLFYNNLVHHTRA